MSVMTGMQYRAAGKLRADKFKEKMKGIGYFQKTHYFSNAFLEEIDKLSSSMSKTEAIEYVFQGYLKNVTRTSLEQKSIKPETTVKIDYDKLKEDTRAKIELITDTVDMTREMLIDMAIESYNPPPPIATNPEDETPAQGGDRTPPPEKGDLPIVEPEISNLDKDKKKRTKAERQILEDQIREAISNGLSNKEIMKKYQISQSYLSKIVKQLKLD